jgi:hypothetical protein
MLKVTIILTEFRDEQIRFKHLETRLKDKGTYWQCVANTKSDTKWVFLAIFYDLMARVCQKKSKYTR